METLKVFKDTLMYNILLKIEKLLNVTYGLNKFEDASPFWTYDESAYTCFLSVLESEYKYILNTRFLTRSKTFHINYVIMDILDLLIEYIPDDKAESSIDERCSICLFNKGVIDLKCGHTAICQKCFQIMVKRRIKKCPICRSDI